MRFAGWFGLMGLVFLVACESRPRELTRRESVDSICTDGKSAYTYELRDPDGGRTAETMLEPAIGAGCVAPDGAWTDVSDVDAGGVRKELYDLRENEQTTVLCCP